MSGWTAEKDRLAVRMLGDGATYADVGRVLGRTGRAVQARLQRAKAAERKKRKAEQAMTRSPFHPRLGDRFTDEEAAAIEERLREWVKRTPTMREAARVGASASRGRRMRELGGPDEPLEP